MIKKLHLTILLVVFPICSSTAQFGDFDDIFVFNGTKPVVQNKITAHDSNCGIQSLTLKWSSVKNEYYYVNSYSLQVLNNGTWTTIQTIPKGGSYSVTLNSFQAGWNDAEANFNFRVRVNVNLEDATTYTYIQGDTLKVPDWCFGSPVNVFLTQATINSGGHISNLLSGQKPTIYVSNIGAANTEYFTVETTTSISGTNFGWRSVDVKTYLSTCPTLGASCSGTGISTQEYNFDLITVPYRVPSGTETFRRSSIRFKVNDVNIVLNNNQTYYLHVRYSINGGTTKGFAWPIRIEYRNNSSGDCIICPVPIEDFEAQSKTKSVTSPYSVDVYDLSGNKIATKTFVSRDEEESYLNSLPKQIYIINSPIGSRKIYPINR
ncbi:hypothetical protein V1387_07685 [Allomuricauda taeanensis]|uniref:hypothetical protein n=1 Tax=Flagellimonas taeanensis TaxID=1005926 RepID=UPI002E7BFA70|nr:hypothetical protein [Allomuricauda taeanensis]MEE1962557.1 hypothetical protein [Allomuricauda taeanensis]